MQTRSGFHYPKPVKRRKRALQDTTIRRKSQRLATAAADYFDGLPDEIVIVILGKFSSSATCPSDLISILLTCKRLNGLSLDPEVLSKASRNSMSIGAKKWCDAAHQFLNRCAEAGNLEACYILGMIEFYCLQNRRAGISFLVKAAIQNHAIALYSLAVIQFNGSGGSKDNKNLAAGVALSAKSASFGHLDALRELGHCVQGGYGVRQSVVEGRRLLLIANARELAAALPSKSWRAHHVVIGPKCPLLSDFGYDVPILEVHPANRFLVEWFTINSHGLECNGLRLCSNWGCGRPETRRHEFRRCSACAEANYCSRACQALHWKYEHNVECRSMVRQLNGGPNDGDQAGD